MTSRTESTDPLREELRRSVEAYYLPQQLIEAIFDLGKIPETSSESTVGIGFVDIADYSFMSKFLSPKENQVVLNGLYTAIQNVLIRHGGYLNKIEGDAIMFHFGGFIDKATRSMPVKEARQYIARELFFTCVEIQRICHQFNQANESFLAEGVNTESRAMLSSAFHIINELRNHLEISSSINAIFQIRVRIGAHIGEVTAGNFGPYGAKRWDVVGVPVIEAKRMESTAPVGGLRIRKTLYDILDEARIVDGYYQRFKREATVLGTRYRFAELHDVFRPARVVLHDKRGAQFETYSVQVQPNLPAVVREQTALLLSRGSMGAEMIADIVKYYRGNPFVVDEIESYLRQKGVVLPKRFMLHAINAQKYPLDVDPAADHTPEKSLYEVMHLLGRYQDHVKGGATVDPTPRTTGEPGLAEYARALRDQYQQTGRFRTHRAFFYDVTLPLVFGAIAAAVEQYQDTTNAVEEITA